MTQMRHVVMFSGGVTSWAAAKRVVSRYGTDHTTLLFADTHMEDGDLYRFLDEAAANIGAALVRIADGRTPWQVFDDERYLGNSRIDPCSKILKRQLIAAWLQEHCDPTNTTLVYGFDWSEEHRLTRMQSYGDGWHRWAPLLDPPYLSKKELLTTLEDEGIRPPRLYALGFSHNNCGGACVKAGQASWALLLKHLPERYRWHEAQEESLRQKLSKDIAILRDRAHKSVRPLTLKEFRERCERKQAFDDQDWGSCGCFQQADAQE